MGLLSGGNCCSLWSCVSCSGPLLPASAGAWPASSHGALAPFSAALADSLLGLPSLQSSGTALLRADGKGEREDEGTHRLDPGPRECHQLSPAPGPLVHRFTACVTQRKETAAHKETPTLVFVIGGTSPGECCDREMTEGWPRIGPLPHEL